MKTTALNSLCGLCCNPDLVGKQLCPYNEENVAPIFPVLSHVMHQRPLPTQFITLTQSTSKSLCAPFCMLMAQIRVHGKQRQEVGGLDYENRLTDQYRRTLSRSCPLERRMVPDTLPGRPQHSVGVIVQRSPIQATATLDVTGYGYLAISTVPSTLRHWQEILCFSKNELAHSFWTISVLNIDTSTLRANEH
ncbi:hypothetical protein J6590_075005 [Homalodisca vitripennis]|nr:hypothetical protein J6590_075005 [Homalodisca vitripennis]